MLLRLWTPPSPTPPRRQSRSRGALFRSPRRTLAQRRLLIAAAADRYKLAGAVNDILHRLCPSCACNFNLAPGPIKTPTIGQAIGLGATTAKIFSQSAMPAATKAAWVL